MLDLMLSLAGPIEEVCGYAITTAVHRMEPEDYACSAVRYANGAVGVIEATVAAYPGDVESIEFIGTKGTAVLSGYDLRGQYHDGTTDVYAPPPAAGGGGADPMAFPHDLHLAVWSDFLDAIATGRSPRTSPSEAIKVHRLIDDMLEAGKSDRKVNVRE